MNTTYQQYANQALATGKKVASDFYEVGSQAAAFAADEAYKLGEYASKRAGEVSKRKLTVKQVIVALIGLGLLVWIIIEIRKASSNTLEDNTSNEGFVGAVSNIVNGGNRYDNTVDEHKTLQNGVWGVNVRALQTLLNQNGQSLTIDGKFGKNTKSALIAVTGRSSITLAAFKTGTWSSNDNTNHLDYSKMLKNGVTGAEVKKLQEGINLHRSSKIAIDGVFGNQTKSALQELTGKSQITLTEWFGLQSSL